MDLWFGLLEENIEANGGTAIAPGNFTRVKVGLEPHRVKHGPKQRGILF